MVGFFIGLVIGILVHIGHVKFADEDCPRCVLGYDCRGDRCDHRKSELYKAKAQMALNQEQRDDDVNYWKGDHGN